MSKPILSFSVTTILIVALFWLAVRLDLPAMTERIVEENYYLAAAFYLFLLALSTIVSPITVLPIVPVIALSLGPFPTAILSILGWTMGAAGVFVVVKLGFLPLIVRFVPETRLARYETYLPAKTRFWFLVMFRMIVPVEISSYLIAIFTTVGFREFLAGTALGVLPFAFIFSYAGPAFFSKNIFQIAFLATVGVLIFCLAYFVLTRRMKK